MKTKYKDTDYLFLSARIHCLETKLLTRQQLEQMLDAADAQDAARVLTELGWEEFDPTGEEALNRALLQERERLFRELGGYMPDPAVLDVFKLKYDYHNIKTIIKSRGGDCEPLLMDAGRFDAAQLLLKYRENGNWSFLPEPLAGAAQEATRVLMETGDPQRSDFLLDRTCFGEMLALAQSTGCEYLTDYVRAMIDGMNLRSLVRTLRLRKDAAFLRQVLFEGGTVSAESIVSRGMNGGVAELFRSTGLAEAAQAGETAAQGGSMTEFEKLCDDALLHRAAKAKSVSFGVEVPIGYVAAKEAELMAVRIVMAGRMAGIPADTIRERLRESYV